MGILSPEGVVTDGSLWNKQVAKIQIIPPAVPEFAPDSAFIVIACFVGLTMFVAFKKGLSIPQANARIAARFFPTTTKRRLRGTEYALLEGNCYAGARLT